jgi:hypothetical protein
VFQRRLDVMDVARCQRRSFPPFPLPHLDPATKGAGLRRCDAAIWCSQLLAQEPNVDWLQNARVCRPQQSATTIITDPVLRGARWVMAPGRHNCKRSCGPSKVTVVHAAWRSAAIIVHHFCKPFMKDIGRGPAQRQTIHFYS